MRYLLSHQSRPILTRIAQVRTLYGFDYDGTLAPITEHPDQAVMRAETRKLLASLASAYPCVVLSGRSSDDVGAKLQGIPIARIIGNHGADVGAHRDEARRQVEEWKAVMEPALSAFAGLWLEDKGLSLAIHYRQASRKDEARRHILEAAGKLQSARVSGGKQVVNLTLCGAPNKGDALAHERDRLQCTGVFFIGDDDNDEDAFALQGDTVSVRVCPKRRSHARYYLRSQTEIDQLLALLVSLRTAVHV